MRHYAGRRMKALRNRLYFPILIFATAMPHQSMPPFFDRCVRLVVGATLSVSLAACHHEEPWKLTDVQGHFPDLDFELTSDAGKQISQANLAGDVTLVYFGYTHCPDVCPETLAKLAQVTHQLGGAAQHVKVLFVSVDPARDTPAVMHAYVDAFDAKHDVGLTGSDSAIKALAQRYRVAYQADKPRANGGYEVTHSSAIYIFDAKGHARLIGADDDPVDAFVHDLRQLADET
ncbi:protein SCO1/2 [Paraburkholderia sp. RAU6.4a]